MTENYGPLWSSTLGAILWNAPVGDLPPTVTTGTPSLTSVVTTEAFWMMLEAATAASAELAAPPASQSVVSDAGAGYAPWSTLTALLLRSLAGTGATSVAAGGTAAGQPAVGPESLSGGGSEDGLKSRIDQAVTAAAAAYGVPAALVHAVIDQESGGNPDAVSPAGAMGLMQLMPDTARALGVTNPFDPVQNIFAGTRYLAELLKQFGGRVDLALAAYNAGPGAVQRWQGIPPYPETQAYVRSILSRLNS